MAAKHHQILIVGGGAAGITVAAHLQRLDDHHALDIAIIDPAESHYYQAAFTLVGGGAYKLEDTRRATKDLIPGGVTWIKEAVATFSPDTNSLTLANGTTISYAYLVVCPGLQINWSAIKGLKEYVGRYGVCSNYSPATVEYTGVSASARLPPAALKVGCIMVSPMKPPFTSPRARMRLPTASAFWCEG